MPLTFSKALAGLFIFLSGGVIFFYLGRLSRRLIFKETEKQEDINVLKKMTPAENRMVSLAGGILALVITGYYGMSMAALTLFLVSAVLVMITVIDAYTQTIPPVLNIVLGALGLVSILTMPGISVAERVIGFFCISVPMFLIVLLVPGGFGGGDIKMMAASGILLGWKGNLAAFFIGLIIGGVYGAFLLISGKKGRKEHFAFGPCLSIGIFVSAYAEIGMRIVDQYLYMIQTMLAGS